MTTDLDLELELLRGLIPEQDGPSPEARRRSRAALLAEIQRGRPPRRRFRLSLGLAAAAVAAAAVVVALVAPRGGVVRPEPAAAALLQRAAVAADSAGAPRPGEYWYVHSRELRLGVAFGPTAHPLEIVDARRARDRQVWIGHGVPGRLVERAIGPIEFLTTQARERWVRAGRPPQLDAKVESALPADRQLFALPTDVGALRRVILARAGSGSPAELLTAIGDLLREQPVPPRVRAALFRIAARIPGIHLIGRTRDGIGRPALDVALSARGERAELLFDPRTAQLLGERYTVLKPGPKFHVKPGTVDYEATYISSAIVGRIGRHASV